MRPAHEDAITPVRPDTRSPDFEASFDALLAMKREAAEDVDRAVQAIIADVIAKGDAALIAYSQKLDRIDLQKRGLRVELDEIGAAWESCSPKALEALRFAHARIVAFLERQLPKDERYTDALGVELPAQKKAGGGELKPDHFKFPASEAAASGLTVAGKASRAAYGR